MTEAAEELRRFNRSHTQRIGALDDRFLGIDRPLAASRLLWDIGRGPVTVADLRLSLGFDSGYLSRLLRRLESDGLIATTADPSDRRRRTVALTASGQREWNELERRSQALANEIVGSLGPSQQRRLAEALATADRLLTAAGATIESVDPAGAPAIRALHQYFDELDHRFDSGFDPGDTITADADSYRQPNGAFLLAVLPPTPAAAESAVACGAVHRLSPDIAEIKRMWVDPHWRGVGLGRRMLERLEQVAASLGCSTVRLDTNSVLTEAIDMYRSSGYRPIERYNDNPFAKCWFEKSVPAATEGDHRRFVKEPTNGA